MRNLAIIPARKGSKRVKGKNTRELFGIPLFERTVINLIGSGIFDEIFVSTNDEKIHAISEKYQIRHDLERDERLCDDHTSTKTVIEDAIIKYGIKENSDLVCVVYPTSIFFDESMIRNCAVRALKLKTPEFLQSVVQYSHPIQRAFAINPKGYLAQLNPEYMLSRTQDLPAHYFDAGQFYWANVETWISSTDNWSRVPFVIDDIDCQDLDSENDWKVMEMKFKSKYESDLF